MTWFLNSGFLRRCLLNATLSISRASCGESAYANLKYLAVGQVLSMICDISLPRIPMFSLPLLPTRNIFLSLSASIYAPILPLGNFSTFSRVNSYHRLSTGISYLQNIISIISILSIKKFMYNYCWNASVHAKCSRCALQFLKQFVSDLVISWNKSLFLLCPILVWTISCLTFRTYLTILKIKVYGEPS